MTFRHISMLLFVLLLVLAGCSNLPASIASSPPAATSTGEIAPSQTPTSSSEAEASITPGVPQATQVSTPSTGETLLRIWLPPEFDPEGESPASRLLEDCLDEFLAEHPQVRLEVRVKALSGTGGLLEALTAANVSAPLSLPDLVLLPRPLLESAALKGLLFPYDDLTVRLDDRNWFGYSRQLASVKSSMYGLPFAGDALVLAYRPSMTETLPHNLEATLALGQVILFPAADPQALFTLGVYQQKGGSLQDEQGRPYLDKASLTGVLEFYQHASLAGTMPYWMTQYSDDGHVWEAFTEDKLPMAVTWASIYMRNRPGAEDDLALAPVPTWDGIPFTLATGWSWALTSQDPVRRNVSTQLAEFLTEEEFLATWSYAAGYLPPRVDALLRWQDEDLRQAIEQLSYSAHLIPSTDLISSLGPALEQAVVKVLKAESDPQTAAQAVIDQVNQP
jgi:multiple sugar transport system substrate-binding protein